MKRLTSSAVLLALCSTLFIHSQISVKSAPPSLLNNKISPDLQSVMQTNGGAKVRVIVQSTTGSGGLMGDGFVMGDACALGEGPAGMQ